MKIHETPKGFDLHRLTNERTPLLICDWQPKQQPSSNRSDPFEFFWHRLWGVNVFLLGSNVRRYCGKENDFSSGQ